MDGKDVQDVTIDSLRKKIGVVPQDTVLFNETIMFAPPTPPTPECRR